MTRFTATALLSFTASLVAALPLACDSDDTKAVSRTGDGAPGSNDDAGGTPQPGAGLEGPTGQWAWHDIPGMKCGNDTPTGIGVNRGTTGDDGGGELGRPAGEVAGGHGNARSLFGICDRRAVS